MLNYDAERQGWSFETSELSGFLLPTGARHGLKSLVHKPTGLEVVHPKYDLFNLFLLFSTNLCMGTLRDWERSVAVEGDSLVVHWPANDQHRVDTEARFTPVEPNAVDLTIHIRSEWVYPAYELFLSNYFPPSFQPHAYVQGCTWSAGAGRDEWIAPRVNDVFVGTGLVFPRDQHVSPRSVDGRWNRIWALYQWNPQRYYARPVLYQADPARRLAAVLMARPEHCFAVVTGYDSDHLDDPFKDQNPLYLCLFGDDLLPGDERTVRARLALIPLDGTAGPVLDCYAAFAAETA